MGGFPRESQLSRGAGALLAILLAVQSSVASAAPAERRHPEPAPATPSPRLVGYLKPLDASLLLADALLPGAPRAYRAGIHEGIDFPAAYGAPVVAARAGTIARIDRDYADWSVGERAGALSDAVGRGATPALTLDRSRGRQVWIDHGDGAVTRYAHLGSVADLRVGERIAAGDVIGTVGSSGLPEGGPHLHFEIRVGDGYLGEGLPAEEVAYVVARAFSPEHSRRECDR